MMGGYSAPPAVHSSLDRITETIIVTSQADVLRRNYGTLPGSRVGHFRHCPSVWFRSSSAVSRMFEGENVYAPLTVRRWTRFHRRSPHSICTLADTRKARGVTGQKGGQDHMQDDRRPQKDAGQTICETDVGR
jgi:hypothetical protein